MFSLNLQLNSGYTEGMMKNLEILASNVVKYVELYMYVNHVMELTAVM